jgi:hypothetical protein
MRSKTVIRVIMGLALAGSAAALQLPPSSIPGSGLSLVPVDSDAEAVALLRAPGLNRLFVGTADRTPVQVAVHRVTP